jgi:hypothetical protein
MTPVTLAAVRRSCLVCVLAAVAFPSAASSSRIAAAAPVSGSGEACAGVADGSTQTTPAPGHPCWVKADTYPFGADGNPVDPTSPACVTSPQTCYLTVTSMAFRAWNRGLAATSGVGKTPFGVWLFNGTRWYPDPTFPGTGVCQGNTVLWAGKLDYWLIGTGQNGWAPLCRFDGSNFLWEPLGMPQGTVLRLGDQTTGMLPIHGGITSGSCLAWGNCWFFGTDGTVLHWDGEGLTDVSPDPPAASAGTTFTTARLSTGATGSSLGLATLGSSYVFDVSAGIPFPTRASLRTQLLAFDGTTAAGRRAAGGVLRPTTYLAPAAAQVSGAGDPYGTDPVAISLDPSGRGWIAANPADWQVDVGVPFLRPDLTVPERSPLLPVSTGAGSSTGSDPSCPSWYSPGGLNRFPHTYPALPGSTLWTSISAFPGGTSAIAGGLTVSTLTDGSVVTEPVLVQANCNGTATTTRFRIPPPAGSTAATPADESGWIEAVAANAPNDGWAATNAGILPNGEISYQPPELYRLTDSTAPKAPAGDDTESRTIAEQDDPATYVYKPPPPPRLPPLPRGSTTKQVPPAVSGVQRKVVRAGGRYALILSFKVRRRVVLGLDAYRQQRLIASTGLKRLRPPSGLLRLNLNRKRWPTRIAFVSDTPRVGFAAPGRLTGKVTLSASAKPTTGRTIKSVQFQYELSGTGYWIVIGKVKGSPFRLSLDTNTLANGTYDLRAVATDSRGSIGISRKVAGRVRNARR